MAFSTDSNTVALWPGDDVSGIPANTLADSVNGITLTATAGYKPLVMSGPKEDGTDYARGLADQWKFEAADPAGQALMVAGSFTMELWVWIAEYNFAAIQYSGPIGDGDAADNALCDWSVNASGYQSVFWEYDVGTNVTVTQTAGSVVPTNTWAHIAITVTDDATDRTVKFYLNGVLQDTQSDTKPVGGGNGIWSVGGNSSGILGKGRVAHAHVSGIVRDTAYLLANVAAKSILTDGDSFRYWGCQDPPQVKDISGNGFHVYFDPDYDVHVDSITTGVDASTLAPSAGVLVLGVDAEDVSSYLYPSFEDTFISSDFTVDWWMRVPIDSADNVLLFDWHATGEAESENYVFRVKYAAATRTVELFWETGAGTNVSYTTPAVVSEAEQWNRHYFAITREYNAGTGLVDMSIYVDGSLVDSTSMVLPSGGSSGALCLHRSGRVVLSDMRISDCVRSVAELGADYTLGITCEAADATSPTVTLVSPADGTTIAADATITFDVTDNVGVEALRHIEVRVTQGETVETIFDGASFVGAYTSSSRAVIAGGWRYTVIRDGGWATSPTFSVDAIDASGNKAT